MYLDMLGHAGAATEDTMPLSHSLALAVPVLVPVQDCGAEGLHIPRSGSIEHAEHEPIEFDMVKGISPHFCGIFRTPSTRTSSPSGAEAGSHPGVRPLN